MFKRLCKNCMYWEYLFSIGRGDVSKKGACRRYPPVIYPHIYKVNERYFKQCTSGMTGEGTKSTDGILPLTSAKECCGEFRNE